MWPADPVTFLLSEGNNTGCIAHSASNVPFGATLSEGPQRRASAAHTAERACVPQPCRFVASYVASVCACMI